GDRRVPVRDLPLLAVAARDAVEARGSGGGGGVGTVRARLGGRARVHVHGEPLRSLRPAAGVPELSRAARGRSRVHRAVPVPAGAAPPLPPPPHPPLLTPP